MALCIQISLRPAMVRRKRVSAGDGRHDGIHGALLKKPLVVIRRLIFSFYNGCLTQRIRARENMVTWSALALRLAEFRLILTFIHFASRHRRLSSCQLARKKASSVREKIRRRRAKWKAMTTRSLMVTRHALFSYFIESEK